MRISITVVLLHCASVLFAHDNPDVKFGKIAAEDFQKKVYTIDSSAGAVVIADIGKSEFEGNNKGRFSLSFTHFKRVHILKKSGYNMADILIPLYVDGTHEELLKSVKAVTYNLENGNIVATKLDNAGVFTDKYDKNYLFKKFTFPGVKEGSIIEFEYTVTSEFLFNLQPWEFQGDAPCLWSEYQVSIPNFFGYVMMAKGYHPFYINEHKDRQSSFYITEDRGESPSEHFSVTSGVMDYKWVMKDVPRLKEENYITTLENYKSKIEFQLSELKEPYVPKSVMQTWPQFAKEMLEDDDFGGSLSNVNNWLSDDVKAIIAGAKTDPEKAKQIFTYVRDHIACTGHNAVLRSQSLKDVFKSKKGNESDINLLLTAMLRYVHIQADPVMLSTREHGTTYPLYPVRSQYNYVICRAVIGEKIYYLDGSRPRLGFNKLPINCYNGTARLIGETPLAIELRTDSIKEKKVTAVLLTTDETGKWVGDFNQTLGDYESYKVRSKIKEEGQEAFLKELKKAYNNEWVIEKPVFDSLDKYEDPVKIQYAFAMNINNEDILYINPMLGEGQKENPFKSAQRLYPVEMPYKLDETYVLTIQVPDGYIVDELPKSLKVKLNEQNDGEFEYLIAQSGNTISLRSRLRLHKANFGPDEYDFLREFFNLVVSKHNEQIVLKKKK